MVRSETSKYLDINHYSVHSVSCNFGKQFEKFIQFRFLALRLENPHFLA